MNRNDLIQRISNTLFEQYGINPGTNVFVRACQEGPSIFMPDYFDGVSIEYRNKLYKPCLWKYPWVGCIDMSKFPGCDHFYSTINLTGWKWRAGSDGEMVCLDSPHQELHNIYRYDILRSVTEEDLSPHTQKGCWGGYRIGDQTRRFDVAKIPIQIAILWMLQHVYGPMIIGLGSRCDFDSLFKLISVDEHDHIMIHSNLYLS